ncbi:unnamed protein product [Clonostachys chloroleuca]|uniref:F-box domain-containing protein n=1 Tax=Clonostachys chloroleuca TaxID=1926264 RepID=A0AA35Q9A6_9HYPO|nr:unnamed protein product [Clonostachys chloroleuca]
MDETSPMECGMNIADLPLDVLRLIFDEFRDPEVLSHGEVDWSPSQSRAWRPADSTNLQTIQNARLACRLFNSVASPLLAPVLRLDLSKRSLQIANGLTQNPLIASGIHGVLVNLDYRPAELANNMALYANYLQLELQQIDTYCQTKIFHHHRFMSEDDDECYDEASEHLDACTQCRFEYRSLCDAWQACVQNRGISPTKETRAYQAMLREGFQVYKQAHEEQAQIIADRSFVDSIASAIARVGHAVSLGLVDGRGQNASPFAADYFSSILNKDILAEFMIRPQSWSAIENIDAKLVPTQILSELPVAIWQSGGALRNLSNGCFPHRKDHSLVLSPALEGAQGHIEDATSQLRAFEFGTLASSAAGRSHLDDEGKAAMDVYLGSMLESTNLQKLKLDMVVYNGDDDNGNRPGYYHIGSALSCVKSKDLRHVSINNAALSQHDLEIFCRSLGRRIESLSLNKVDLLDGSWFNALERLRDTLSSRCLKGLCEVSFSGLSGGEFGDQPEDQTSSWPGSISGPLSMVKRAEQFVSGMEERNVYFN